MITLRHTLKRNDRHLRLGRHTKRHRASVLLRQVASNSSTRTYQNEKSAQSPSLNHWRTTFPCHVQIRSFSTIQAPSSTSYTVKGDKLRVAIVGAGASALSSALHLAPLVDQGFIEAPVDVYSDNRTNARDVGVGVWSTAIDPFLRYADQRTSHKLIYECLTETHGTWLGNVGYRTPNGDWLMKSHLPTSLQEKSLSHMPGLLFLRERDLVETLKKAVHWEEIHHGTIRIHGQSPVVGLYEESIHPWSTNILLQSQKSSTEDPNQQTDTLSERHYHLIVAADGMHSVLRDTYGGHGTQRLRLTGASALPSPIELSENHSEYNSEVWDKSQHRLAVGIQDRNYTVFRGNSPLARNQLGEPSDISFQTWGTGKSMRFATVPMMCPSPNHQGRREEKQVWFITTDNNDIAHELDPTIRREKLLHEFRDWHNPIATIVSATPPEDIYMERALAHRHSMGPVLDFNTTVQHLTGRRPPSAGEGPCITFIGDAYMTVDPILAQGFTNALEGGAALSQSIERLCTTLELSPAEMIADQLAFDPFVLRKELRFLQQQKNDRVDVCRSIEEPAISPVTGGIPTLTPDMITDRPTLAPVPIPTAAPIILSSPTAEPGNVTNPAITPLTDSPIVDLITGSPIVSPVTESPIMEPATGSPIIAPFSETPGAAPVALPMPTDDATPSSSMKPTQKPQAPVVAKTVAPTCSKSFVSKAPTTSPIPSFSQIPTGSEIPTTSQTPTESEIPTMSLMPTDSESPSMSQMPTDLPTTSHMPTSSESPTTSQIPTGSGIPTTSQMPTGSAMPTIPLMLKSIDLPTSTATWNRMGPMACVVGLMCFMQL